MSSPNRRTRKPPRSSKSVTCKKRNAASKYQVGTSGFMVSKPTWLSMPCLNCIEINSTFYHLPKETTIESWRQLPEHVGIVIKASKYITHIKRLKDVGEACDTLWSRIKPLGRKLRCVLFQLPPSFVLKDVNLARIQAMKAILPSGMTPAFEFRDASWFVPQVYKVMKKLGFCMVGTFIKKQAGTKWLSTMPSGLLMPPRTASISYLRVHGARGYRGALTSKQLLEIRTALAKRNTRHNFVMFNNTFFDQRGHHCDILGHQVKYAAVCNAAEFTSILKPASMRRSLKRSS